MRENPVSTHFPCMVCWSVTCNFAHLHLPQAHSTFPGLRFPWLPLSPCMGQVSTATVGPDGWDSFPSIWKGTRGFRLLDSGDGSSSHPLLQCGEPESGMTWTHVCRKPRAPALPSSPLAEGLLSPHDGTALQVPHLQLRSKEPTGKMGRTVSLSSKDHQTDLGSNYMDRVSLNCHCGKPHSLTPTLLVTVFISLQQSCEMGCSWKAVCSGKPNASTAQTFPGANARSSHSFSSSL